MFIAKRRVKAIRVENIYDVISDVPRRNQVEFENDKTDNLGYEIVEDGFTLSSDQVAEDHMYEIVCIYDVSRKSHVTEPHSALASIPPAGPNVINEHYDQTQANNQASHDGGVNATPQSSDSYLNFAQKFAATQLVTTADPTQIVRSMGITQVVGTDQAQTYNEQAPSELVSTDPNDEVQTYERTPKVDISELLSTDKKNVGITQLVSSDPYDEVQTYERAPNVRLSQLLANDPYERVQTYERAPINVRLSQLLAIDPYERVQTYEQVPNVDICMLVATEIDSCKQCSIYERAPHINIKELFSASNKKGVLLVENPVSVYEQVPHVDLFQILASCKTEMDSCSERTPTSDGIECADHVYVNVDTNFMC